MVLISVDNIKKYLKEIPPVPENVRRALEYLKNGELKKAAMEAEKDIVLKKQIERIVNSAYFSLPNRVEDSVQLFSMIGIEMAKNLIYSYLVSLLKPKEWKIFHINFEDFQADFLRLYEKYMIIEFGEETYKKYSELGALIPAAVVVADSLLGEKKEKLELITSSAPIEIGTLLKRMTGVTLFGIAAKIAQIWELEKEKIDIISKSECIKCDNKIAALIHFLFFYLVSKPQFIELNSLIEFNPECIKYIPKTYERIQNDS
jgi:HD-like signal output (HDOD) protein